jgi:hypothetical protein
MRTSLLLLLISYSFFLSSCKKDGNDPDYYFKIKVDGNWITYEGANCELGPDLGDPSLTDFVVNAGDDDVLVSVALQSTGDINTGAYVTSAVSPPYYLLVEYWKIMQNDIQIFDCASAPLAGGSEPEFTLNITSISNSEIRGTISGNFLHNYTEDETINVTEGEFVARRF